MLADTLPKADTQSSNTRLQITLQDDPVAVAQPHHDLLLIYEDLHPHKQIMRRQLHTFCKGLSRQEVPNFLLPMHPLAVRSLTKYPFEKLSSTQDLFSSI